MDDNSFASTPRRDLLLCWLALAAYALVVLRSAWLTEDAYITFRTVDHCINGFGLRWNIAERVQTYTNPLWMLSVAFCYLLTGEIFYTAIALSVATSLLAVFLFIRHLAASLPAALLGTALLCSSKGFIDYSTSGLENPLSHLLLATFAWIYLRRPNLAAKLWPLSLLAALAVCNRMDTALLYAPALLYAFWPRRNLRAAIALLTGFAPLVLWIGFSLVYYGFPFPNTAYFKLGGGIPAAELAQHGLFYLYDSLSNDPLALITITASAFLIGRRRQSRSGALGLGAILYLLYVIKIGGDFYSGRFISLPLFTAVIAAAALQAPALRYWPAILLSIVAVGAAIPGSPLLSQSDYTKSGDPSYINDERGQFYQAAGLLPALRRDPITSNPDHWWVERARRLKQGDTALMQDLPHSPTHSVRVQDPHLVRHSADGRVLVTWGNIGYSGFFAGPEAHILNALADPLLARLPARQDLNWRPGHFSRIVPPGYIETLLDHRNALADSGLATFYDALRLVTRGPLFAADRWTEIWKINSGQYQHLIDRKAFLYPSTLAVARSDLSLRPGDPLKNYALGQAYLETGQNAEGIAAFDDALSKSPRSHNIRQLIGAALYKHGDYYIAAEAYRQAIELQPDRYEYHAALGAALKAEGVLTGARLAYSVAARLHDQDPIVYYGLGMVEMEMGHAEAAIRALHRVIDLAGDTIDSPPYTEVGIALFSLGDTSGSSRAYALSLAKDPNDLPALINLGWNHYSEGRLDSAVTYFELALARTDNSVAHFNLALAYLASGDVDRAREVYEQALTTYGTEEARRIGAEKDIQDLIDRGVLTREARRMLTKLKRLPSPLP